MTEPTEGDHIVAYLRRQLDAKTFEAATLWAQLQQANAALEAYAEAEREAAS